MDKKQKSIASIDKKSAEKILEADLKNIVSKVASGKPLTTRERKVIEDATSKNDELATTKELIKELGLTRSNFYKYKSRSGSPQNLSLSAWKKFLVETQLKGNDENLSAEDVFQLKAKLLKERTGREEVERKLKEIKLEREEKGFVPLAEAKQVITRVLEPLSRLLEGIPKKYSLRINPSDPDHAEEMLREMVIDIKGQLQLSRGGNLSKRKGVK